MRIKNRLHILFFFQFVWLLAACQADTANHMEVQIPDSQAWQAARLSMEQNDYHEALKYYERALKYTEYIEQDDSPEMLQLIYETGIACQKAKQYRRAVIKLEHVLEQQIKLGEESEQIPECCYYLGQSLLGSGDHEGALAYQEEGLDYGLRHFGGQSDQVIRAYCGFGMIYTVMGQAEKAQDYYDLAVEQEMLRSGKESGNLAEIYAQIAEMYSDLEDYEQEIIYRERVVAFYEESAPKDKIKLSHAKYEYAKALSENGQKEASIENLNDSINMMEGAQTVEERLLLSDYYYRLGRVHDKYGDEEKAVEYVFRAWNNLDSMKGKDETASFISSLYLGELLKLFDPLYTRAREDDFSAWLKTLIEKYG